MFCELAVVELLACGSDVPARICQCRGGVECVDGVALGVDYNTAHGLQFCQYTVVGVACCNMLAD